MIQLARALHKSNMYASCIHFWTKKPSLITHILKVNYRVALEDHLTATDGSECSSISCDRQVSLHPCNISASGGVLVTNMLLNAIRSAVYYLQSPILHSS